MGLRIFIDDERTAPEDYDLTFRNADDFFAWLSENEDTHVAELSLDYFLADEFVVHTNGLDIAKKLTEVPHSIRRVQVHSDYYDGGKEIFKVLQEFARSRVNPLFRGCYSCKIRITDDGQEIEVRGLSYLD